MTEPPLRSGHPPRLAPPLSVHRAGETSLLAVYPDTAAVLVAAAAVRALAPGHLLDLIPAERTLLLSGTSPQDLAVLSALLRDLTAPEEDDRPATEVSLGIVYDGQDLDAVAELLGMSTEALIAAHSSTLWTAAFGGFAPGFSYLVAPDREAPSADPGSAGPQSDAEAGGDAGAGPDPAGPPWDVPRRAEPRTAVPAGAVGLASHYCAVYPRATPGGWQLIGRSDAELFDPRREHPALLAPGTRVRFAPQRPTARAGGATAALARATRGAAAVPARLGRRRGEVAAAPAGVPALEVRSPGPLAVVEDAGRPGRAAIGVGTSGAFDRGAMVRANLAVGNPARAAILEALLGPLFLTAVAPTVIAVSGAPAPLTVRRQDEDGADLVLRADQGREQPIALDPGDTVELGPARSGLRLVLAVRGGIRAVQHRSEHASAARSSPTPGPETGTGTGTTESGVLGSMSHDTLSGLGPAPLGAGDLLLVGPERGLDAVPASAPGNGADTRPVVGTDQDPRDGSSPSARITVPLHPGPRDELLGAQALTALLTGDWTVRPDSDRVGVRLDGEALPVPAGAGSLPSEAVVPGAIQVPPSGLPVVFGPDHPTTGGYPVIAVVTRAGLDLLAQAAPGTTVGFVRADGR